MNAIPSLMIFTLKFEAHQEIALQTSKERNNDVTRELKIFKMLESPFWWIFIFFAASKFEMHSIAKWDSQDIPIGEN